LTFFDFYSCEKINSANVKSFYSMAYIAQSTCASSLIPTANGDVLVKGGGPGFADNRLRVTFPVNDPFWIERQCASPEASQVTFPGGCANFLRNNNLYQFVENEQKAFGPSTDMLIDKLGTCQSEGLVEYLNWKQRREPRQTQQIQHIANVCGVKLN
jgi:hypothetical protein